MRNNKYIGAIALSYVTMFFEGALNVVLVAFMMTLATQFGKNQAEIALLVSLKSFGTMMTLYLAGHLSDKFGRKWIMLLGLFFFVIFLCGFAFIDSYAILLIVSILGGIGHGLMDSPGMTLIFDAIDGNAGPAMSLVQVFFAGGGVVATLMGSLFIARGFPYQNFFILFLGLAVILLFMILRVNFPPVKSAQPEFKVDEKKTVKNSPLKAMTILMVCMILSATFQSIMTTWTPTFAIDAKNMAEAQGVSMLSAYQIGSVVGAFVLSYLLRKFNTTTFMVLNPFFAGLFVIMILFVSHPVLTVIGLFGIGFFQGVYFSLCINMGGVIFAEKAGAATGAIGTVNMLGFSIMITATGWFVEQIGVFELMVGVVFVAMLLSSFAYLFRKQYKLLLGGER